MKHLRSTVVFGTVIGFGCLLVFSTLVLAKKATVKGTAENPKPISAQVAVSPALPLVVEKLYLKQGMIHVVIQRKGKAEMPANAHDTTILEVGATSGKNTRDWTLREADPEKKLRRKNGKIDFDTGLPIIQTMGIVATLTRGKWKTSKNKTLSPVVKRRKVKADTMAAGSSEEIFSKTPRPIRKQPPAAATLQPGVRGTAPKPVKKPVNAVPMRDDTHGLEIVSPEEGDRFFPEDSLTIRYRINRQVSGGEIRFQFLNANIAEFLDGTISVPYHGNDTGLSAQYESISPLIPDNVPPDRYVICGRHFYKGELTGISGCSDPFDILDKEAFAISPPMEITSYRNGIEIGSPGDSDRFYRGYPMEITYRLNQSVGEGTIDFILAVRNPDTHLEMITPEGLPLEPEENFIPIAKRTRAYRPSPSSVPEPAYSFTWVLPEDLTEGERYIILAIHSETTGRSGEFDILDKDAFVVASPMVITECDYSIESVQIGERSLEEGVEGNAILPNSFDVIIKWNGNEPSLEADDVFHNFDIVATKTGESIINMGAKGDRPFNYTMAGRNGRIRLKPPVQWEKEYLHTMMEGDFIPLEFRILVAGDGLDRIEVNNVLETRVKVNNYVETDLEVYLDPWKFTIRRYPRVGKVDEYRLNAEIRIRNLSRNVDGSPPAPVDTLFEWAVEYKWPGDEEWSTRSDLNGRNPAKNVGGNYTVWPITRTFTGTDRENVQWRFKVVVDPWRQFIDPDRNNNVNIRSWTVD